MFAASKSGSVDAKDPQFNYVTMLLHGNGTNGAQNNTFVDSSTNNFTITRNGNTTQGTFTPYGSNWSNAFATSAAIRYPYTSSLTSWWTQDFTMEMWIFNNTNAVSGTNSLPLQFAHGIYNSTPTYWSFGTNASGQLNFYYYNGSANNVTSTTTASLGTWNHIAMVYTHSSGNISLYLNGVSVASATKSGTPQNDNTNQVNIGAVQSTYYNGYISNLRVLNGTALYSSTFTPSTTPLTAITNTQLLTCQSNRFVDNSTNNATPTLIGSPSVQRFCPFLSKTAYSTSVIGGSGYFDGTGDYLSIPDNAAFDLGSGDFTIECWAYTTAWASSYNVLLSQWNASTAYIFRITSGLIGLYANIVTTQNYTASVTNTLNTWDHYAVTRSGTTLTFWKNGVSVGTSTIIGTINNSSDNVTIGIIGDLNSTTTHTGYISNMRLVKGTAVYTSNFTPSTAPLTAITNTSLLLSYTNAGILDNAMMNDLETVGNAQISTSVKKYGTGSMYFDGTGDYLLLQGGQNFTYGTGDFTIEMWIYVVSGLNADIVYYDGRPTSTNGLYNIIYTNSTGKLVYNTNSADRITGTTTLSTGTWYHIALSRSGTSTKLFLNGTQEGSTYTDSNSYIVGTNRPVIGGNGYTLGNAPLNGYIDDLRITKGVARYTANFSVPTAAFPDKG